MGSSRKRRAGQARRIAAANAPPRIRPGCMHGCPPAPATDDHIMFQCWELIRRELEAPGRSCVLKLMEMVLCEYEPILHTPSLKTTFRKLVIAKGTSLLLYDLASNIMTEGPSVIADLILLMDDYDKQRGLFDGGHGQHYLSTMQKIRDLHDGDQRRALTRFYARKIPCNCLHEHDAVAKTEEKRGYCFHCKKVLELRHLNLCNGCKYNQYCSVECQREDWPLHKTLCNDYARLNATGVAPTPPGVPFCRRATGTSTGSSTFRSD